MVDRVIRNRGRKSIETLSFAEAYESTVFVSRIELLWTKCTRLTGSKSPVKVRTSVPMPSETPVMPNISGIPTFTEEVQRPPKDSITDPSVKVNTCITGATPSTADSEGVIPQTSIAVDSIPSSAPEIFYGPDGLPLPPVLIAIEEIVEDPPSSTPSRSLYILLHQKLVYRHRKLL